MIINLDKVSKRYTRHWIIRNLTLQLVANEPYALLREKIIDLGKLDSKTIRLITFAGTIKPQCL